MITHRWRGGGSLRPRACDVGGPQSSRSPVRDIFYTRSVPIRTLFCAIRRRDSTSRSRPELRTIPGQPPHRKHLPPGCAFPRAAASGARSCRTEESGRLRWPGRRKACHLETLDPDRAGPHRMTAPGSSRCGDLKLHFAGQDPARLIVARGGCSRRWTASASRWRCDTGAWSASAAWRYFDAPRPRLLQLIPPTSARVHLALPHQDLARPEMPPPAPRQA